MKFLILLGLLALCSAQRLTMNPCHKDKKLMASPDCTTTYFPTTLCKKCLLNIPNIMDDGNLESCDAFYDVENDDCLLAFEAYVEANPCDTHRAQALAQAKSDDADEREKGRISLDYFAYAVCEECCDCIPHCASVDEANTKGYGAIVPDRGNCPAHYYYDICSILPNMVEFGVAVIDGHHPGGDETDDEWNWWNLFGGDKGKEKKEDDGQVKKDVKEVGTANYTITSLDILYTVPEGGKLCGEGSLFQDWFDNHRKGWPGKAKIDMSEEVYYALETLTQVLNCSALGPWQACHYLEDRQNRLGEGDGGDCSQEDL